jgi:hypothetical protein
MTEATALGEGASAAGDRGWLPISFSRTRPGGALRFHGGVEERGPNESRAQDDVHRPKGTTHHRIATGRTGEPVAPRMRSVRFR